MVIKGNKNYCWRAIARVGDIQSLREIKVSDVSVVSQKQFRYKVVRGEGKGTEKIGFQVFRTERHYSSF